MTVYPTSPHFHPERSLASEVDFLRHLIIRYARPMGFIAPQSIRQTEAGFSVLMAAPDALLISIARSLMNYVSDRLVVTSLRTVESHFDHWV
jgi:hypothetical protein